MLLAGAAKYAGQELNRTRRAAPEHCERGPNFEGRALIDLWPGSPKSVAAHARFATDLR
jgi:hypothetical protein